MPVDDLAHVHIEPVFGGVDFRRQFRRDSAHGGFDSSRAGRSRRGYLGRLRNTFNSSILGNRRLFSTPDRGSAPARFFGGRGTGVAWLLSATIGKSLVNNDVRRRAAPIQ